MSEKIGRVKTASAAYRHPQYAESFSNIATPLHLSRSNGWLLARQIPGTEYWDAIGTYPLFCCDDWGQIYDDISDIGMDLVSIVLVTDVFANFDRQDLESSFDKVRPYKNHFVVDLTRPLEDNVSKTNRATARRALRKLEVRVLPNPLECIDEWMELYSYMIRRQDRSGFWQFTRESFMKQFSTPGAVLFEASADGDVIGLDMLYVDNDFAYGHLCAFSELGYKLRASYATRWRMLEYLKGNGVRFLDFGSSAGAGAASESDSLANYKKRWCAETKPVYLCSKVCNQDVYNELSRTNKTKDGSDFFPAYRSDEF